MYEYGIGNVNL